MKDGGYTPTDKLDTSNPPNNKESKMIKVNSIVIIKELNVARTEGLAKDLPPIMIVEGLYYRAGGGTMNITFANSKVEPKCAKCIWYNTQNELQCEFINLELLTEL